ncbi:MAG: hypothetical protein D0528_02275 [Methylococcales bacterium]|nr:MAG: hypothetical protein D0528_02275 [Methylococcales bacterium]
MQDKSALSIPAQTEQEITLEKITADFAQVCFDYGALMTLSNIGKNDRFKWASEHANKLSITLMAMYRQNEQA